MNDARSSFDNRMCKVTSSEVLAIRRRYAEGGVSYRALGDEYGVTGQSVANIVSRSSWAWLADEDDEDDEVAAAN